MNAASVCFSCSGPATIPIFASSPTPAAHVCKACDQAGVADRVRQALVHVENAQRELMYAREQLSPIAGGASILQDRIGRLQDRVHKEWYALRDRSRSAQERGRWSLADYFWAARFKEGKKP